MTLERVFHNGDGLDMLKALAPNSIDLFIVDPPYNIAAEMQVNRGSQGRHKGNDLEEETYGWDSLQQHSDYWGFTEAWVFRCKQALKPGGFIVGFFDRRHISHLTDVLTSQGCKVRDFFTWVKTNPVPVPRGTKFAQGTELAVIVSKEGPNIFQSKRGYHPNYIRLPIVSGAERLKLDGKTLHPTQKPLRMYRLFVDYLSPEGGIVGDPFAGVGTTAVAAVQSGRGYVCAENHDLFYIAAQLRLKTAEECPPEDYKSKAYREKYL